MRIKWFGHACFLITTAEGIKILTDPFDESVPYPFPEEEVDVVTVSHEHFDHNAVGRVKGTPEVVRGLGEHTVKGVSIWGIPSFHDQKGGRERGRNTIFRLQADGITLAHLGDLGHTLNAEQQKPLEGVEVVLIPVGGHYTIGPQEAVEVIRMLPALKIAIPMHVKTELIKDWPIAPVEEFLSQVDLPVQRVGGAEVEITREGLPREKEVWVLSHA